MIKLLIVDDEAIIRQGLRQAVDWSHYGIVIAGEAKSGMEALQKARQLQPDIIISDIRMGEGDGLSLAKELPQILPHARMIMLSGYSDMEYMMEAIKSGVRDYLLKPAGSQQILESVLKLRDEILQEHRVEQQSNRIESLINENLDVLKALFLEELLSGKLDEIQIRDRATALGVNLCGPCYQLLLIEPAEGKKWELVQLVSSHLERCASALLLRETGEVLAILNVDRPMTEQKMGQLAAQLAPLCCPMSAPCLAEAGDLSALGNAYSACVQAQARSIWHPGKSFIAAQPGEPSSGVPQADSLLLERGIVQAVRAGNHAKLQQHIEALFTLLRATMPDRAQFQETLMSIARSIQVFSEHGELYLRLEQLFLSPYTVSSVREAMLDSLSSDHSRYGPQVKSALGYMSSHYTDGLSLADVAQVLYISPSYLTRLLKSKTGKGFIEWLHIIRINKSKELLEQSDLHNYEIAERVGYKSYKIFSEYFSKIVGCSARSYRESVMRRNG